MDGEWGGGDAGKEVNTNAPERGDAGASAHTKKRRSHEVFFNGVQNTIYITYVGKKQKQQVYKYVYYVLRDVLYVYTVSYLCCALPFRKNEPVFPC